MEADQNSPYNSIPDWALKWKEQNYGKEIYVSPMNIYSKLPAKSGGDLCFKGFPIHPMIPLVF